MVNGQGRKSKIENLSINMLIKRISEMHKLSYICLLLLCCSILVACTDEKYESQTNTGAQAQDALPDPDAQQTENLNQDGRKDLTSYNQYSKDDRFTEHLETKWQDGYLCFKLRINVGNGKKSRTFLNALCFHNVLTRLHSHIIVRDNDGFQLATLGLSKIEKGPAFKDHDSGITVYQYSSEGSLQFSKDLYQKITQFGIDWGDEN
jgi:hypothetical protein